MSAALVTLGDMSPFEPAFPRFVYVPWRDDVDFRERMENAASAAVELAEDEGLAVMAVASAKDDLPSAWGKRPYRTRKSTAFAVSGPAVEVHIWPALADLGASSPLRAKHAFVIEFAGHDLSGWARHSGALHADTGATLAPTVSETAAKIYTSIDFSGNNGWADQPGRRDALRYLQQLKEMGELHPVDIAGYLVAHRQCSREAITRLLELAQSVSQSVGRPSGLR